MLEELVFRAESKAFVPDTVSSLDLNEATLEATIEGRRGDPSALVKAVTYHRLRFEREGDGFRASVVLDV